MEGWTKILTSQNSFLAQMITLDLQAAGFDAVLVNKKDSSYVNFGFCEVFVPASVGLEAQIWLFDNHPDAQQT